MDLKTVRGNDLPKRAIEIAVAGGHNLTLMGDQGTGKTMLALCAAQLYRRARDGRTQPPRLFDHISGELVELELLHEGDRVEVIGIRAATSAACASATSLLNFILTSRTTPWLDGMPDLQNQSEKYVKHVHYRMRRWIRPFASMLAVSVVAECRRLTLEETKEQADTGSEDVLERVKEAVGRQRIRYGAEALGACNANAGVSQVEARLTSDAEVMLDHAYDVLPHFTMARRTHALRVARTVADLDQSETIEVGHMAQALDFRFADLRWNEGQ